MTTDGSIPPPCDLEIFSKGEQVFVGDTIPSNDMEGWVKQVAQVSGQPVDWHYIGGYAEVLALGDIERVRTAIRKLMPEYYRLWMAAIKRIKTSLSRLYRLRAEGEKLRHQQCMQRKRHRRQVRSRQRRHRRGLA